MSKSIELDCTVIGFGTEKNRTIVEDYSSKKNRTIVEDYGSKKNELKIEEGIMEINAYDITPDIIMHHLSDGQWRDMERKFKIRPTKHAREMRDNTISR